MIVLKQYNQLRAYDTVFYKEDSSLVDGYVVETMGLFPRQLIHIPKEYVQSYRERDEETNERIERIYNKANSVKVGIWKRMKNE